MMNSVSARRSRRLKLTRLLSAILLFGSGAQANAADFACAGHSPDGELQLVFVQADQREQALEAARERAPRGRESARQPMVVVNQCIILGEERFRDPAANTLLERTPR